MQGKTIIIASDHAGCPLKAAVHQYLAQKGYVVIDYGTNTPDVPVDYPDIAYKAVKGIYKGEADMGILVCGTGIGMGMAVNRYNKIRGAVVWNPEIAALARKHNNANVLLLPGRFMDDSTALACVDQFLSTPFEGGRHENRVNKLERMPSDIQ